FLGRAPEPSSSCDTLSDTATNPSGSILSKGGRNDLLVEQFAEIGCNAEHGRNTLNEAAGNRPCIPAGCGAGLWVFRLGFVYHDDQSVSRIVEWECRSEEICDLAGRIAPIDHLFGGAGLAADAVALRSLVHLGAGALKGVEAHEVADVVA